MSDLINFVYDRTVDYIQNSARNNPLRDEYDRYMSSQNYNNNEMANLVEVIAVIADGEIRSCRTDREAEATINDIIKMCVDANCGSFGLSDRRIADSVDDEIYTELKRADAKWNDILDRLSGNTRGARGGSRGFGGGGSRSVFDRDSQYGQRRNVFDRREPRDERASNSVFATRQVSTVRQSSVLDRHRDEQEPTRREEPRRASNGFGQAPARQEPTRQEYVRREEPARQHQSVSVEEERVEGPDMTKERPYDDFWMNGENWQIAHRSKFTWSWSPKQQTRRAYDPDNEVRFLVKGVDGTVREEFIAMTDDLLEEAHVIRQHQRPNRPRIATERAEGDSLFVGEDIDAVDLDALQRTHKQVRKELLSELVITNPHIGEQAISVTTLEEAAVRVAGEATKVENDVVAMNNIISVQLAGDEVTHTALESIKAIGVNEGDLLQLQKRLKSLRGTVAENVLTYLDKHFTTEVNAALRDQFGLPKPRIDSFIEDFEDLLNCSTFKKLGQAYSSQFLSRTRILLASVQYIVEQELREEFLECTDILPVSENDPEAYAEYRKNVVVLFKLAATVHVKVNADQFGYVDSEVRVPARTGKGADPVLADTLTGLYAIGRKTAGAGHVYVVTADNLMYELVPISGARDIIGIRTA